jgi:hypothetical protein
MKKIATTLFGFLFLFTAFISAQDIITWDFSLEDAGNGEVNIIAKPLSSRDGICTTRRYQMEVPTPP